MKTLGTDQFLAMKFERLPLSDTWQPVMGNLPECFSMLFFGPSSMGKTECALQFVRDECCRFGKVEWMEYESGHGADIRDAVARNNMKGLPITWTDPWHLRQAQVDTMPMPAFNDIPTSRNVSTDKLFMELVNKIAKQKSAKYWVINSVDASGFTSLQVLYLLRKFGNKKGLIFIGLADGMTFSSLRRAATKEIYAQGQIAICVFNYIAGAVKNRFSGDAKHVVYEKKARELDPLYFATLEVNQAPKKKERKKRPPTPKASAVKGEKEVTENIDTI